MDQPTTFARHFSRLVWLLVNEPASTDDQKGALRAIVSVSKDGVIRLSRDDGRLHANGAPLPDAFAGVPEVGERLDAHGIVALEIAAGAKPADLLHVARLLASDAAEARSTPAAATRRLGLTSVRLEGAEGAEATESPAGAPSTSTDDAEPRPAASFDEFEIVAPHAVGTGRSDAPSAAAGGHGEPVVATDDGAFLLQDTGAMYSQFMSASRPIDPAEILFQRVDAARGSVALAAPLEELVNVAEQNAREGRTSLMADIFAGLVKRESAATDDGCRRAFAMSIRRISSSFMLNAVAALLPRARSKADDYRAVLVRAGENGADALIEQLSQTQTAEDRRAYFDVLLTLGAGVPALVHMLGDPRWFVVRNAAELLGEMQAVEAEGELTAQLRHGDERVRRAVKVALTRLGTPTAVRAIEAGLRDPDPVLRQEAAAALSARKRPGTAQTLIRALEDEQDQGVQVAILAALGKIASTDAVERLHRAAEPEGRLFRRKPTPVRIAAVQALADAKTTGALAAIATLTGDKDRDVREIASRALAAASK